MKAAALVVTSILVLASADASAELTSPPASLTSLTLPGARLLGGGSRGGYSAGSAGGGPLLGLEGAWATTLPAADDPAYGSWAFGARAGWAFANGLALHVRYDDLGVEPASSSSPLQLATVGLRYSLPFVVPLPFAEVDAGSAFVGGDARFGAGAALGASVPIGPHVLVDLVGHDWLVPIAGELRQTLTGGIALTVTFASPTHASGGPPR